MKRAPPPPPLLAPLTPSSRPCCVPQVIKPDMVLEVPDEGLPVLGHSQCLGSLIIQFEVKFPERCDITPQMRKLLADVLKTPLPPPASAEGASVALLREVDVGQLKQREQLAKDAYDSDEEEGGEGGGPPGVQCAQQ